MSNKTHRLLTQGELHTPERSGNGDPNQLSLQYVVDGQYYQDKITGSVYRYSSSSRRWELLIGYNKSSNKITNVSGIAEQSKIGELRATIGKTDSNQSGIINSIQAYLYTQVRAGEEIVIISVEDTEQKITLTVTQTTNAGEVTIPVQEQRTQKTFLEGSAVQVDGSLLMSYFSIDPTKLSISIDGSRSATSYGEIASGFLAIGSDLSTLGIVKSGISESNPVVFRDGQVLTLQRRDGLSQEVTVNGNQTFTSSPYDLLLNEAYAEFQMASSPTFFNFRTYVVEPFYRASSRISLTESSIQLAVRYEDVETQTGSYVGLFAGPEGSEITIQADQINVTGVITAINDEGVTTIDGDRITTGSIRAAQIDVNNLFAEQITIGSTGYIESSNYVQGSDGFRINADGTAEFRDVTTQGEIITGVGSQIDGQYIVAQSVTANKIAANTITASQIAANTITAAQIAASTITANELSSNSVTADKIDVIDLQAVSVSTGDLTVDGRLTLDSGDLYAQGSTGNYVVLNSSGITGVSSSLGTVFNLPSDGSPPTFSSGSITETVFEIDTSGVMRTSSTALDGSANSAGVLINNTGVFAGQANQTTSTANVRIKSDGTFYVGDSATDYLQYNSGVLTLRGSLNADDITAGTLSADRIAADSIDSTKIDVDNLFSQTITVQSGGSIKSSNYSAGTSGFTINSDGTAEFREVIVDGQITTGTGSSVDGQYITANTVTATQIAANTITATEISASTITAAQIAANTITAAQIASNTITASQISAGTITATELAASSVTADKISVSSLSAITANLGTITAGTIDASLVTVSNINAGNITSGTISADRIGANTITADKINVLNLEALGISTGALTVDGTLTISTGGQITGSNYSLTDAGGNIAGWIVGNNVLQSATSGKRIELSKDNARVSIVSDRIDGYITSATTTTITDSKRNWQVNQFSGLTLRANGTNRTISSNTSNTITVSSSFGFTPSGVYEIVYQQDEDLVAMGYLDGLQKNGASGQISSSTNTTITDTTKNWEEDQLIGLLVVAGGVTRNISSNTATTITVSTTFSAPPTGSYEVLFPSNTYGFWAKDGDRLFIDGDVSFESGDWIIKNDGSLKILDSSAREIVRLGTDTGEKGLFLYDIGGAKLAQYRSDAVIIGDDTSTEYLKYQSGVLTVRGSINADDITAGTLSTDRLNIIELSALTTNTGSLNISGTLTMGANGIIENTDDDYRISNDGIVLNAPSANLQGGENQLRFGPSLSVSSPTARIFATTEPIQVGLDFQSAHSLTIESLNGTYSNKVNIDTGTLDINADTDISGSLSVGGISGNLSFPNGNGIDFSATANGSGSSQSELLDDYEEGTWSPTYELTAGTVSATYDRVSAKYIKIGNQVVIQAYLRTDSLSFTGSGNIRLGGLPFTVGSHGSINIGFSKNFASGQAFPQTGYIDTDSKIYLQQVNADGEMFGLGQASFSTGTNANHNAIIISGTYTV